MKKEKTSEENDPNKGLIDEIRILSKRIKKLETEVEMLKNLIQQEHLNETSVSEEQQENPTKQDVEDTPKRMEQTTIYLSAPTLKVYLMILQRRYKLANLFMCSKPITTIVVRSLLLRVKTPLLPQ